MRTHEVESVNQELTWNERKRKRKNPLEIIKVRTILYSFSINLSFANTHRNSHRLCVCWVGDIEMIHQKRMKDEKEMLQLLSWKKNNFRQNIKMSFYIFGICTEFKWHSLVSWWLQTRVYLSTNISHLNSPKPTECIGNTHTNTDREMLKAPELNWFSLNFRASVERFFLFHFFFQFYFHEQQRQWQHFRQFRIYVFAHTHTHEHVFRNSWSLWRLTAISMCLVFVLLS